MEITIYKLQAKYDHNTEIPYRVWWSIKINTIFAVYWAKKNEWVEMQNRIYRANETIKIYNNMLHYFKYDLEHDKYNQPITYYELTGYEKIENLINAIYNKNQIPF